MADYETGTTKGTIKTFIQDQRGEFAFIVPDDGGKDIFVHATTIWEKDITITPKQGDRIEVDFHTVDAGKNKGGRRATEVLAYEVTEAETKAGTLKWFRKEKGYGFVAPSDGGADVFLHRSIVEQMLGTEVEAPVGATLDFQIGADHAGRSQVTWFTITAVAPAKKSKSRKGKSPKRQQPADAQLAAE